MDQPKTVALARLQLIADALGVSVDQFTAGRMSDDLPASEEYWRLWSQLKTETGRQQALSALRRLVEEEAV